MLGRGRAGAGVYGAPAGEAAEKCADARTEGGGVEKTT
jgi:hypothetical protein